MDRYEIGCSQCGVIGYETSKWRANRAAERAALRHSTKVEQVTIYDRLAHYGAPELWDANGKVLRRKVRTAGKE